MKRKGHRIVSLIAGVIIWIATFLIFSLPTGKLSLTELLAPFQLNWYDLLLIFPSFFTGYMIPDTDLTIEILHHRDWTTHSSFITIFTFIVWIFSDFNSYIGLSAGVWALMSGLHFICDLKPGEMLGFAKIYILNKALSSTNTKIWLIVHFAISFSLGIIMLWIRI